MTYWNYRIIHKIFKGGIVEHTYTIHEVFYDEIDEIEYWTLNPVIQHGETIKELKENYDLFAEAFDKPVLIEKKVNSKEILIEEEKENK